MFTGRPITRRMTAPLAAQRNLFDAAIIGGGPAGLSAALTLGRARRRVLLVDDSGYRNRPAHRSRGFLTRDGAPPDEIIRIGREQLEALDVTFHDGRATGIERLADAFALRLSGGSNALATKVLLASGVSDELPDIPGLREMWGRSVFHCPYCHGWEVRGQPLALMGRGKEGFQLCSLLLGWSDDLILFTDGPSELDEDERRRVERKGVRICEGRIARLAGEGAQLEAVVLDSGESVPRTALFLKPGQRAHTDLAVALGCSVDERGHVEASPAGRTDVEGFFVAGDAGPFVQQVIAAAASGATAAIAINDDLLRESFKR
jgi:thioredoxin reductase